MNIADLKNEFIDFWNDYFQNKNIDTNNFTIRLLFSPKELEPKELGVTFFKNELPEIGNTLYFELVNKHGNNVFPYLKEQKRVLYCIKGKKLEEYKTIKRTSKSGEEFNVYFIPFRELSICSCSNNNVDDNIEELTELDIINLEDKSLNQMTVRDLYCILHNVPASKTRWLNELIKNKK